MKNAAHRPATAILLQTHTFDAQVRRLHAALQRACGPDRTLFVLMHVPPGTRKPATLDGVATHFVTTPEVRAADFPGKSAGEPWTIWGGGHTDLIAMHFARQHRTFEHYWVIEYDVRLTGRWRKFFDHFANSPADLLATTVRSFESHPGWPWWDSATDPSGQRVAKAGMLCAFMPIFRFSRAAAQEMERRYQEGWSGHTELTWPSYLNDAGLVVEDLGGNGTHVSPRNRGRFYRNRPYTHYLGPGSLVWRPAKLSAGLWPNRLYHPIKPPRAAIRDQWDYNWSRASRSLIKVRSKASRLWRRVGGADVI